MMKYRTVLTIDEYYSQTLEHINESIKSNSIAGLPSLIYRIDTAMPTVIDQIKNNFIERGYYCELINLKNDQFIYINWSNEKFL